MFLAPCFVVQLYSTNRRNAQFYKLIFNFYRLLPLWNLVSSSLGEELYVQYCMSSTYIGVTITVGRRVSSRLRSRKLVRD